MKFPLPFPVRGAIAGAAVALVIAGCGGARERYESHLQRGKQYLAQENLDKAGIEFRNALQIQPKDAPAFYYNGRVAEARQRPRQAVGFYLAALDADPKYDDARARLAKVYVLAGSPQRALDVISPGIERHPEDADLLAARAAARHQLEDNELAREDAEHAVRIAPDNENAVAVLAALYISAGKTDEALKLVGDAVARLPASVQLHEILAQLDLNAGRRPEAEAQLREIIRIRPRDFAARVRLASEFSFNHNLDAAQQVLEDAVRDFAKDQDPGRRNGTKLALTGFLASQRSAAAGEQKLRAYIAADPHNSQLQFGLAEMLDHDGDWKGALAVYQAIADREGTEPQGMTARVRLAGMQYAHGHPDLAGKLVAEVLKKNPRDVDALFIRANLRMQDGDATSAIADLRTVVQDQPKSVRAQQTLARAFLQTKQPGLAEEAWRAAIQAAPNDPAVLTEFVQFLIASNRAAQAVPLVEQFVTRLPENPAGRELLARAYLAARDVPKAREAAHEIQTRFPESAAGFYLAGMADGQDKRWDDSRKQLEHALTLAPKSAELWATLARVDLARGDAADSMTEYEKALSLTPADTRIVVELAALYERQGKVDAAISRYDGLYQASPAARELAANNLAMLLVTYRTDASSLDRARQLTSDFSTSDNGALLDTSGWVRFKRREYQDAVALLERAVEHAPDSRVIRYHLGMAELQAGQRDRARTNLETALQGQGTFSGAEEARTALASLSPSAG
jgi:tetratricopeptide (TPR) repeat protein